MDVTLVADSIDHLRLWQVCGSNVPDDLLLRSACSQSAGLLTPVITVARERVRHLAIGGLFCLTLVLAPRLGQAQVVTNIVLPSIPAFDTGPGTTVLTRAHPEFDSPGVSVGDFVVRPQLTESAGYNDNVLALNTPSGSGLFDTSASLGVNSNWSRDSLGALVTVDDTRYLQQPHQDQTAYTLSLGGSLDIGRDQATLAVTRQHQFEELGGIDVFNSGVPIPYDVTDVRASYLTTFGRFSFRPALDFQTYRYSNYQTAGIQFLGTIDNLNSFQGSLTTEYELAPLRNLVLTVEGANIHYLASLAGAPARDSNGGSVLAGIDYSANSVFRYFFLVGYQVRSYTSAAFQSQQAPIVNAGVVWTPTGLTTISGSVNRQIADSTSQTQVGYTLTDGSLRIDHEYLRNVVVSGRVSVDNAVYNQVGLSQTYIGVGGSVNYLVNRNTTLSATYDFSRGPAPTTTNSVVVSNVPFVRNVFLLRLNFHL